MSSSVSPPCSGSDVSICVQGCCLATNFSALTSACAEKCSFLCGPDGHVHEACGPFCHLATWQREVHSNSSQCDYDVRLEVVVCVLAGLVAALALTVIVVVIHWFRHGFWKRTKQRAPNCNCKNKSSTTVVQESKVIPSSAAEDVKEKMDTESPGLEKSSLDARHSPYNRLDMDARSLCDTFTDDEFHDAWTPGTSPSSVSSRTHIRTDTHHTHLGNLYDTFADEEFHDAWTPGTSPSSVSPRTHLKTDTHHTDLGNLYDTFADEEFHDVWTPGTSPSSVSSRSHLRTHTPRRPGASPHSVSSRTHMKTDTHHTDLGNPCDTFTDDEFHDVWTPGTSPVSVVL